MKPGIHISKIGYDDGVIELKVEVSDGSSLFLNRVYVERKTLIDAASNLYIFKDHFHGGLLDVQFGAFGCEYTNGGFHARFHFPSPGRLYVTSRQETEFEKFSKKMVASKATMYVKSEPVLLDRFITELQALASGASEEAFLEGI